VLCVVDLVLYVYRRTTSPNDDDDDDEIVYDLSNGSISSDLE